VIRIEFELTISDDPGGSYCENRSYSFNRVVLEVISRRMQRYDSIRYEPDTEQPEVVGEYNLGIRTLREVKQLAQPLRYYSPFGAP
jgi:hypothetical protein